MNKKIIVSVFLCLFVLFSMLLSQEESKEKKVWEDERIGITLDKFEKTDSYPSEFKSPGYRYPPPKKGYDFIVIHITVAIIKDVHLGMPQPSSPTKPNLVDAQGKIYKLANLQYKGIEYREGLKSDYEIIQGAKGIFLFEFSKKAKPALFKFAYPYWESWEEKVIKYGQIDIDLSHIQ